MLTDLYNEVKALITGVLTYDGSALAEVTQSVDVRRFSGRALAVISGYSIEDFSTTALVLAIQSSPDDAVWTDVGTVTVAEVDNPGWILSEVAVDLEAAPRYLRIILRTGTLADEDSVIVAAFMCGGGTYRPVS